MFTDCNVFALFKLYRLFTSNNKNAFVSNILSFAYWLTSQIIFSHTARNFLFSRPNFLSYLFFSVLSHECHMKNDGEIRAKNGDSNHEETDALAKIQIAHIRQWRTNRMTILYFHNLWYNLLGVFQLFPVAFRVVSSFSDDHVRAATNTANIVPLLLHFDHYSLRVISHYGLFSFTALTRPLAEHKGFKTEETALARRLICPLSYRHGACLHSAP